MPAYFVGEQKPADGHSFNNRLEPLPSTRAAWLGPPAGRMRLFT